MPLPLRCTEQPWFWAALAARTILQLVDNKDNSLNIQCRPAKVIVSEIANAFNVDCSCMKIIYMSPSPYYDTFDEVIDLRCVELAKHHTTGLLLLENNRQRILTHMSPGTPSAKIPCWCTWLWGAWLVKIFNHSVTSICGAQKAFETLLTTGTTLAQLLFAHP